MKLLGKIVKQEKIVQTLRPVLKMVCDRCGEELTNEFAAVSISHRRWGNDSWESLEHKEFCFDCVKDFFAEYVSTHDITDRFEYEVLPVKPELSAIEVREDGTLFISDTGDYKIEEE